MSKPLNESQLLISSFKGIEQRTALCDQEHVVDAFNVEFIDGTARRRLGRQKVLDSNLIRPSAVLLLNSTTWSDLTAAATDGIPTVAIGTNLFNAASQFLAIGAPFKFTGINLTLLNAFSPVSSTITVQLYNRTSGRTLTTVTVTDGTSSGGKTLQQSGTISWSFADWAGTSWSAGADSAATETNDSIPRACADLYFVFISTSTTGTGGDIAEAKITLLDKNSLNLRAESSGMAEFVTSTGKRMIVSSSSHPGRFNDSTQGAPFENRVVSYDLGRGDAVPLRIPHYMKHIGLPGRPISYAAFNGWLIGSTSSGHLWKFDGTNTSALEALPGLDAVNNVIGAQGYTPTPFGTMLEVYRNRLAVAGNPLSPLSFQLSMEDNNVSTIPPNATVGGPNVWPLRYFFNVPGKQGDRIMGASVINDRYCILTRNQLWVFDDSSLKLSNGDIGCVASGSVQRVDNTIFFLSDRGVAVWDSVNFQIISDPLYTTFGMQVNWSAVNTAASAHDKLRGEYWLWLPINGEQRNQIAVVYNYLLKTWRVVGGWYPWDTNANRDAGTSPAVMSVTAACSVRGASGKQVIISSDANGILWQESIGYDDDTEGIPAYMLFRPMASRGFSGEDYVEFRDWYVTMDMDKTSIQGIQLGDGEKFEQEIDRQNNSVAMNSQTAIKVAAIQNAVPANTSTPAYQGALGPAYPVSPNFMQPKKLKLSFGRLLTKMQAALVWAPSSTVLSRGTIYEVQLGETPRKTGR